MRVHVEWGAAALQDPAKTTIIVDCLSFSTALSVACAKGTMVFPFGSREGALKLAQHMQLDCVGKRKEGGLSLSPPSLEQLTPGKEIILPSPNGSNLSTLSKAKNTFAGALRNAKAVAGAAQSCDGDVMIVAAGERWQHDGSLRPAFEDQLAAGAIASFLTGEKTVEATAATAVFDVAKGDLFSALSRCESGQELIGAGFSDDVEWAAKLNATACVPKLLSAQKTYRDLGLDEQDAPENVSLDQPVKYYAQL